jgi:uncharacterized glyoxalase superfamily protein PhnB
MATRKTASTGRRKTAPSKKPPAQTLRLQSASPSFTVNDLGKSLAWYRDVLGFRVEEKYEREGNLVGVGLQAGGVFFMLGQDDWKKGRDRKKGEGFRIYCMTTQDVDALARKIQSAGGTLDQEPRDQPWGMRDFSLTDPDGYKITIAVEKKKR